MTVTFYVAAGIDLLSDTGTSSRIRRICKEVAERGATVHLCATERTGAFEVHEGRRLVHSRLGSGVFPVPARLMGPYRGSAAATFAEMHFKFMHRRPVTAHMRFRGRADDYAHLSTRNATPRTPLRVFERSSR